MLLDLPEAPVSPGNWFFALRFEPDITLALRLYRLALAERAQHQLTDWPIGVDRLHVSLHPLKQDCVWEDELIERTCRTVANIEAPFEVTFDTVATFGGHFGQHAMVLRGGRSNAALDGFWRHLGLALTDTGLGQIGSRAFTPHVILLHDHRSVADHAVEPITWTVTEFFLVQSLVGESRHVVQRRWPLRG